MGAGLLAGSVSTLSLGSCLRGWSSVPDQDSNSYSWKLWVSHTALNLTVKLKIHVISSVL